MPLLTRASVRRWLADDPGRTITALARAAGTTQPHLSAWLSGRRDINLSTADTIFDAMASLSSVSVARVYTCGNKKSA